MCLYFGEALGQDYKEKKNSTRDKFQTQRARAYEVTSRCHELNLPLNRVCTGQSSDSERALDQWQCADVAPQVNLSFSFVSRVSKHLIECIAIES